MIGWLDLSAGVSGDMLLGALLDAGVPVEVLDDAVAAVAPEPVQLSLSRTTRAGLTAQRCHVTVGDSVTRRTWPDVEALLDAAPLPAAVASAARAVFLRLAAAESQVHGIRLEQVHFHEVGALDAIADVVGVCAGFAHLGLDSLVASPVAVGSGRVHGAHGSLPVPVPAVVSLLRGLPSYGGPAETEACTPTGAALVATLATSFGPQPPMSVEAVGTGAGRRDPDTHANVTRLLLGHPVDRAAPDGAVVLETNVDDLDPRLWPGVIAALLEAGASDAWLTPIVMKKGRPAHTLSVLARASALPAVRRVVFRETSTIGVREHAVGKTALEREELRVVLDGLPVRVKVARLDGEVVNVQPEYEDVADVARATGRPAKVVLAQAQSLAQAETGSVR